MMRSDEVVHEALAGVVRAIARDDDGSPALTEWVLVASTTDLETGNSTLTRLYPRDQLGHQTSGLLHEGLYGDWGSEVE